jgi:alkanesulfonate monooxygenase SsuD/methylene tetrahydromethanopterin reductase-like flavin-dependent oxidoreductase (luciferase family)
MTDYGHPLLFGSFITPASADPGRAAGLAVLAEQAGLDLVTFQDHPYQPAFLDTWTLLSFVAARTSTVRLSANVTNLPLRPPAVLARSVASLDLLSGGRVELGLGSGAFWDAIEAMGGRRLTGGQALRALDEAIEVIRQVWDTGSRGGVRVRGEFYRVAGAKRGPAPAHDVGIWLGAYQPRMLALTGRRADGWLPSLSYLEPGALAASNKIIDEAAGQAGRSPARIRRLLNINGRFAAAGQGLLDGPPAQWAQQLAELAIGDGISAFILASDEADDIRRFAAEVAPAVRELVAAERGRAQAGPAKTQTGPAEAQAGRIDAETGPASTPAPDIAPVGHTPPAPASQARPGGALTVLPTPDDGTRRSGVRLWDEAARPTGPAPDPGRSYTPAGQAGAQDLVNVHNALRDELSQIYDVIGQVAAGLMDPGAARSQISQMTIRQNKWTLGGFCESYCRIVTVHHALEDQALFPHLRRADPRLGPVIGRLAEEHHAIHGVLDRVDRALVAFVSTPAGADALRAEVDLLSDTLLSHLAYEERELIEPIARLGLI